MTVNRGLWVPINTGNVGTVEVEARLADNALFEPYNGTDARSGLLNPTASTIVTGKANMSYDIAPVNPVINRVAGEGVYRFSTTGASNIATTAAPAANSRIDIIWVKQNDQSKGDANNLAIAGVTQGTVAASPVAPAIPAGALEIARATVGPNITATTSASITQTYRYAALRGNPVPVRNTTERAEISGTRLGYRVARLDLDSAGRTVETWNGTAWAQDQTPLGIVSYTQAVANSGAIGSAFAVVNNVSSFLFRAKRKYRISWDLAFQTSAANVGANVLIALAATGDAASLTTGLTQLKGRVITAPVASQNATARVEAYYTPTADDTRQVKWVAQIPSGTMILIASADGPADFVIEDTGAVLP